MRAKLIAFVPFTTADACQKHEPEGYGCGDDNKPVLHARVVVGPVKDAAALARTKAELQAAGFTSFARKAPKLVANNEENAPNPAAQRSAVADK